MTDLEALARSCTGVVPCGGSSLRMGVDKASLLVEGAPLAARPVAALRAAGVAEVLTVGGVVDDVPGVSEHVPDDWPGDGPLGAIATAARRRPGRALIVLACDLPSVTACTVRQLVHTWADDGPDPSLPIVVTVAGTPQWLVALLPPRAASSCAQRFTLGVRSLHEGVDPVRFVEAERPAELADLDDAAALADWCRGRNVPE